MKLKKEIQAIKELNEQEKQAQAAKAAAQQVIVPKNTTKMCVKNIKKGNDNFHKKWILTFSQLHIDKAQAYKNTI